MGFASKVVGLPIGLRMGPYEILGPLGAGGMGEVYRALDPRLGREVAIKVLAGSVAKDPERLARFEREARAAGGLNHPNIVGIHDFGESEEGLPYLVCELLEGETLRARLGRGGVSVPEALEWAQQVAHGLAAAHAKGVVHRDLKPENLFLTRDGRLKILDFGLADLRQRLDSPSSSERTEADTARVEGTTGYMSPEQLRGLRVDARSDIFSLGVVLYELLARERPFRGHNAHETAAAILRDDAPPLGTRSRGAPASLERVVGRCLAKRPESRFQSCRDLALALEAVSAGAGTSPLRDGAGERSPYPGLAPFEEAEAEVFFGRRAEIEELRRQVTARHLVGVIGPSGAGKTSFLRAGVLPALPEGWRRVLFSPGRDPTAALCRALIPALSGDIQAIQRLVGLEDAAALLPSIAAWRQGAAEALLVVDQFEELFTVCSPAQRARFVAFLGRLVREADVRLLLSLRDDFLFRCNEHEALAPLFTSLFPLGPLSADGLRRALVLPAQHRGYRFEDEALVQAMLDDVREERGALPLLAFTAERLWLARDTDRRMLTRAAYEETGGVGAALARHAEATLQRIGTAREEVARELLRNLVTSEGTRLRRGREELLSAFDDASSAREVLQVLIGARLLASFERAAPDGETITEIELVHESLVTAWPRLVRWRVQDAEGALLRDQLRQASRLWDQRGRPSELLWTGRAYREFQLWWDGHEGCALVATEQDFAAAMLAHHRRRSRRRRAVVVAGFVVLTGALASTTGFYRRAQEEVRLSRAARLEALGRNQLGGEPSAALAFALASLETADTPAGRQFAREVLWRAPMPRILPIDATSTWRRVALSPDGEWLAASSYGDLVRVWSRDGVATAGLEVEPGGRQRVIEFLPDSRSLLTTVPEAPLRLFSVPSGALEGTLAPQGPGWFPWGIRRPDGRVLVVRWAEPIASSLGLAGEPLAQAFAWDVASGATDPLRPVHVGVGAVATADGRWLTLRQNGDVVSCPLGQPSEGVRLVGRHPGATWIDVARLSARVLTADDGGEIRVWRLGEDLELERSLQTGEGQRFGTRVASGPRLDPRGTWVAALSRVKGEILLWNLQDPAGSRPLALRYGGPNGLAFDARGEWLAVADGGAAVLWPLDVPRPRVLDGHSGNVLEVRFAPDGGALYSASMDGTVRKWPLAAGNGAPGVALRVDPAWSYTTAVSPDGRWLVGGFTGGARLLLADLARPEEPPVKLDWPEGVMAITGATFSPRGRRLVVTSNYSTEPSGPLMRVWDLESLRFRDYPLRDGDVPGARVPDGLSGYSGGASDVVFANDGRLFAAGSGGIREWDLAAGVAQWRLRAPWVRLAPSIRGGRLACVIADSSTAPGSLEIFEVESGLRRALPSHGHRVAAAALDPSGTAVASGGADGVIRVGRLDDSEPHLLFGHDGGVTHVSVSPDGAWVASGGSDATVRLWPMPETSRVPLQSLPYDALLEKLRATTNRRIVESDEAPSGYRLALAPFHGWRGEPIW